MSVQDWVGMQDRVFSLYGEGRLQETLTEADRAAEAFPDIPVACAKRSVVNG